MLACLPDNFSTPPRGVTITAIPTRTSNTTFRNPAFTSPLPRISGTSLSATAESQRVVPNAIVASDFLFFRQLRQDHQASVLRLCWWDLCVPAIIGGFIPGSVPLIVEATFLAQHGIFRPFNPGA